MNVYEAVYIGGPKDGVEGEPCAGGRYYRIAGTPGRYVFKGRRGDGMLRYEWEEGA